jgi:predicted GIY-YIG superfamily endonuclease
MPYHVYVILCEDGSLHIGYATKVDLGMKLHMRGMPTKLVYVEEFASRAETMKERENSKCCAITRKRN